jgi:hypothetical protein
MNVWNLKVDRRASLRLLTRWGDANEKPYTSSIEERHLGRSGKQEWQTKDVSIEGDTFFEIIDRNQKLSDFRVREVHFRLQQVKVNCGGA